VGETGFNSNFIMQLDNGTTSFHALSYQGPDDLQYRVDVASVIQAQLVFANQSVPLTEHQMVGSYATDDFEAYLDGTRKGTGDQSGTRPTGLINFNLAIADGFFRVLDGTIQEIRYYDTRFDNATLEALSSGVFPDLTGLTTQRKDADAGAMWYNRMKAQREADLERFNKMMDAIHRR
jgi:hypothetical protein